MIEKIRELVGQADKDSALALVPADTLLKFAELIVKECAKIAYYNTPDNEELEYGHLIGDKIKQHFGVE